MESLLNTGKPGSSEARAVLEAMMEGIAVLEGEKYRWMNGHHAAMYGWRPDELIGKTWRELYVPAEQQWIERHAFPELQARGTWRGDVVGRKKDGTPTEVEISLALSPNGTLICCCRDINERKRQERAVRDTVLELDMLNERLRTADRLKDEFLACMSHELRTPLHAVLGDTELLLDPDVGKLSPKQRHYVEQLDVSGRHLLRLINDILDTAKVDAGHVHLQLVPTNVAYVVDISVGMIRKDASQKELAVVCDPGDSTWYVLADERRLVQVLVNLLSNAVKFTPAGGTVILTAQQGVDYICISVTDTGIGISLEDQKKLFQAFRQFDGSLVREHGGTGLGLYLTKRLTELHGGCLSVTSEPGRGTCFTVALSRCESPSIVAPVDSPEHT